MIGIVGITDRNEIMEQYDIYYCSLQVIADNLTMDEICNGLKWSLLDASK